MTTLLVGHPCQHWICQQLKISKTQLGNLISVSHLPWKLNRFYILFKIRKKVKEMKVVYLLLPENFQDCHLILSGRLAQYKKTIQKIYVYFVLHLLPDQYVIKLYSFFCDTWNIFSSNVEGEIMIVDVIIVGKPCYRYWTLSLLMNQGAYQCLKNTDGKKKTVLDLFQKYSFL